MNLPNVYYSTEFMYLSVSWHILKFLIDYNTKIFYKGNIIDNRKEIFFRVTRKSLIPEAVSIYLLIWTPYSFINLLYLFRLITF